MLFTKNSTYLASLLSLLKRNVAIATTFDILLFSLFIALTISISSFVFIQQQQSQNIQTSIKQLAKTVETTASIASFTNDAELAKEVARGLMNNEVVSGVRVYSEQKVLFASGEVSNSLSLKFYEQTLFSPFDATQVIGVLQIDINQDEILLQSYEYAKFISLILFGLTILISIGLSFAINVNIIKPIKTISDTLHHMDAYSLSAIEVPVKHERDEIGRLVDDINQLTHNQKEMLLNEKNLRIKQEIAQKRTQLIFEKNSNGLFLADYQLNLTVWNSALGQMLFDNNLLQHDRAIKPNLIMMLQIHQKELKTLLNKVLKYQTCDSIVLSQYRNGFEIWIELTLQVLDDTSLQGIVTDVSNHKKSEILARAIAEQDALTGLLNRRGLEYRLLAAMTKCQLGNSVAFFLVDLDGFKAVNDTSGHHAGDYVLQAVSDRLKKILHSEDIIARLGGDEFVVVVSNVKNMQDIENIALKMIDVIKQPFEFEHKLLVVGASIGISITNNPNQDTLSLMKQADSAMYEAKSLGKGQFFIYGQS